MEPQSAPPVEPVAAGDSEHPAMHSPEFVAGVLDCSVEKVRDLISSGELGSYRLGHRLIRISDDQLEQFLEARRTGDEAVA